MKIIGKDIAKEGIKIDIARAFPSAVDIAITYCANAVINLRTAIQAYVIPENAICYNRVWTMFIIDGASYAGFVLIKCIIGECDITVTTVNTAAISPLSVVGFNYIIIGGKIAASGADAAAVIVV